MHYPMEFLDKIDRDGYPYKIYSDFENTSLKKKKKYSMKVDIEGSWKQEYYNVLATHSSNCHIFYPSTFSYRLDVGNRTILTMGQYLTVCMSLTEWKKKLFYLQYVP